MALTPAAVGSLGAVDPDTGIVSGDATAAAAALSLPDVAEVWRAPDNSANGTEGGTDEGVTSSDEPVFHHTIRFSVDKASGPGETDALGVVLSKVRYTCRAQKDADLRQTDEIHVNGIIGQVVAIAKGLSSSVVLSLWMDDIE